MKMLNEFVLRGSPDTATAQQKGLRIVRGHAQFYEKKEVSRAKEELADALLCYVPNEPYTGKLYLRVMWLFSKKSLSNAENLTFKESRPDLDNLIKSVADVMTGCGFWEDDSQIVKLDLQKGWNKMTPGLYVQIIELEPDDYNELVGNWRAYE